MAGHKFSGLTSWECCDDRHSECKFQECACVCHAQPAELPRTPGLENRRVLAFELNDPGSFEIRTEARPDPRLAELLAAGKEAAWMLDQCHALQDATRLRVAVAAFEEGK